PEYTSRVPKRGPQPWQPPLAATPRRTLTSPLCTGPATSSLPPPRRIAPLPASTRRPSPDSSSSCFTRQAASPPPRPPRPFGPPPHQAPPHPLPGKLCVPGLVEQLGQTTQSSAHYKISEKGREQAVRLLEVCGYVGPAPVRQESYAAMLRWQFAATPAVREEQ